MLMHIGEISKNTIYVIILTLMTYDQLCTTASAETPFDISLKNLSKLRKQLHVTIAIYYYIYLRLLLAGIRLLRRQRSVFQCRVESDHSLLVVAVGCFEACSEHTKLFASGSFRERGCVRLVERDPFYETIRAGDSVIYSKPWHARLSRLRRRPKVHLIAPTDVRPPCHRLFLLPFLLPSAVVA